MLFDSVINSRWFLRTSIILFLNKIDVFKNKLPKVRIDLCACAAARLGCWLTATPGAARTVLPRVHRRRGHQQGREVHPLAVHAGEPGAAECLPTVRRATYPAIVASGVKLT